MKNYPVVTLCGSTRFKSEFENAQKDLTLKGYIVISVGLFGHAGDKEVWEGKAENTLTETKRMLDDMHKRKIDMADEIFVVNPGGYIGESTWSEIRYACMTDKKIASLCDISADEMMAKVKDAVHRARFLANQKMELLRDVGESVSPDECPSFMHKGVRIYHPWLNEQVNADRAALLNPDSSKQEVEPFSYYGKENVADYIEKIIGLDC